MQNVVGTWSLISLQFEFADTREFADMYGAKPLGFLILTEDQQQMTIITSAARTKPENEKDAAALFESMMAYSGKYRLEGQNQFITEVQVAWHPAWVGTEQARFYEIDGDILSIVSAQMSHPMFPGKNGRAILKWHRVLSRDAT